MNEELKINNSQGPKPLNSFMEKDEYLMGERCSPRQTISASLFQSP